MKTAKALFLLIAVSATCPGAARAQSQIYNFVTIAGVPGYGSADGTNQAARFQYPSGVAVDTAGSIYVTDTGNHIVRKLKRVGTNWVSSTIGGFAGNHNSVDGTNSDSRFYSPFGVAVDVAGNVYVADRDNHTIRKLTLVGTNWVSSTIAGLAGTPGSADGTNSSARFNSPQGVATDTSGNVYVADSINATVRKLTSVGTNWVSSTIAGQAGSFGSDDGTNNTVRFGGFRFWGALAGVAVDKDGNIYVTDTWNSTIRKLTQVGTNWVSSTIAGLAGNYASDDGTNSTIGFSSPLGVTVGKNGNVYVADQGNYTIRELTKVGTNWVSSTISGLAGSSGSVDGTNSDARFLCPSDVAVDGMGNVYVADTCNSTIRALTPVGSNWVSSTVAGLTVSEASADGTNSTARFNGPFGAAVDNDDNVYVTDNRTIRKLTLVGTDWVSTTVAGLAGSYGTVDGTNTVARFNDPTAVAVDAAGNVYVTDAEDNTIRKLTPVGTNWVSSTVAGLAGTPGYTDGANSYVRFFSPSGIAFDHLGNMFVADQGNKTIRKLTPVGNNWVSSTIAGLAGSPGSADGTNSAARFGTSYNGHLPGIAVDAHDNVYLADTDNFTIRKLTPLGTDWVSSTIAGLAGNSGSADGTNSAARFKLPTAVAVDAAGNVYVTDAEDNTIRKLMPVGTNWVSSTIAGRAGYAGSADGTNTAARLSYPAGIGLDGAGNLYVADAGNNSIRKGVLLAIPPAPPVFQTAAQSNGLITLTWSATVGRVYQLQYSSDLSSDLTPTAWHSLGNNIMATNDIISASDLLGPERQRFYRIALLP
jgi:hypothetical protein